MPGGGFIALATAADSVVVFLVEPWSELSLVLYREKIQREMLADASVAE